MTTDSSQKIQLQKIQKNEAFGEVDIINEEQSVRKV